MVLTPQETSLISAVRMLSAEEADRILAWARQLRELSSDGPMQWSDSWSEQDMEDATASAIHRFDVAEQEDR